MAKKTTSSIISAILYVIVGILLIIFPGDTINIAMTVAGIFFIISGILEAIKKNWFGGAISIIIGIVILALGAANVVNIACLVFGVLLAVKGIIALVSAIVKKGKTTVLDIVFPILTTALGVFLAFGNLSSIIVIVVGALLVLDGVVGIISAIKKN